MEANRTDRRSGVGAARSTLGVFAVAGMVLEHLERPAQAIRELARVSRENILLSVPFEPYFQSGSLMRGKHLRHLGNHPEHINHWNPRIFQRFLAPMVDVIRVETSFPWILTHCRRMEPAR